MKDFRKYDIPFVGLKEGEHRFFYELGDTFFGLFENPMIEKAKIELQLDFHKKASFFDLHFNFSGFVHTVCDRCAQDFELPLENRYRLLVKFNQEVVTENKNEDILWISEGDTHINIAESAYEFAVLSLPMRRMHPDKVDGKPGCDITYGEKTPEVKSDEVIDPRWEALKKLKK